MLEVLGVFLSAVLMTVLILVFLAAFHDPDDDGL